jgi:hypothetical protein
MNVLDPCITNSLNWAADLNNMILSVGQLHSNGSEYSATQGVPSVVDKVSQQY